MEIVGNIKNYDWGKVGAESMVAQLAILNSENFKITPSTRYAELWMGDHASGPSTLKNNGEELSKVVKSPLPFLFKVLSIQTALSIQVHPNKSEAERLHKERPDIYKDPNHKPELAIALTPFEGLCGFRPYTEIIHFLDALPPLSDLITNETIKYFKENSTNDGFKKVYEKLMYSNQDDVKCCVQKILCDYQNVLASNGLLEVFLKVNADFPNDVGVLSLFFLNLVRLKPGEAIFLSANEIHAYLSGDVIECMACSDNVIRAGLTPKYKDVSQLISCLNYTGSPASEKLFKPEIFDEYTQIFVPPVNDFAVVKLELPNSVDTYNVSVHKQDSILLVLQGERSLNVEGFPKIELKRGSIVYIPTTAKAEIKITSNGNKDKFIAYMAMKNNFRN